MKRARTSSFVAEFPLRTSPADERELAIRLDAARQIYNACLGESLRRLARLRASHAFQLAKQLPAGPEKNKTFKELDETHGFTAGAIQKYAEACRDACWIGAHLGSHDTQTTSTRAFDAAQRYSFGKKGKPRFKGYRQFHSIEGKSNNILIFREDKLLYFGLSIPILRDARDKDGWEQQVFSLPLGEPPDSSLRIFGL